MKTIDILVDNGTILTVDAERRIITEGSAAIDNGRILAVDKASVIKKEYQPRKVIDAQDKLVMPGLVDGHAHLGGVARGVIPDDLNTSDWLRLWAYHIYGAMVEEDEYYGSLNLMAEMIKTGTTCFVDPGLAFIDSTIEAIEQSGMRCVTGPWTWDQLGPDAQKCCPSFRSLGTDEALSEVEDAMQRYRGAADGRVRIFATLEGVGTCSDDLMVRGKELANQYGTGILMHKASSEEEVRVEIQKTGHRPVEHMYHLGLLDSSMYLNHMIAVSGEEVEMLAETDTRVCQNPSAALRLAKGTTKMGKFPEMVAAGVTVALGCDGANSSNHKDMVRAMYLAATLPRDARVDPKAMTAEKAIEMATIDGARAIGWEDEIGSIEVGKKADIILFDMMRPEWVPLYNVVYNLVYSASGDSVDTVIVDGRVLMENRELKTIDELAVIQKVQSSKADLLRRAGLSVQSRWKVV